MSLDKQALELHKKLNGKIEVKSKYDVETMEDLSLIYTPGVAAPCRAISEDHELAYDLTMKDNTVLIVSDGSAVLGLGNIGPEASLPVMEGKAALFKQFANINAFPIVLKTQDPIEIVNIVKNIAPGVGGVNLEDISAPRCFDIEQILTNELDIPVMHDDQHGTAIVCAAGLINALKIVNKKRNVKILINGMGAAGIAITKLLINFGFFDFCLCDKHGVVYEGVLKMNDLENLTDTILAKKHLESNKNLEEAIKGRDVFIGVSAPDILDEEMVKTMNDNPIVFAMANPIPELSQEAALKADVAVYATGRSDSRNQINNVLAYPGVFRGALDVRAKHITTKMKMAAVEAIMSLVSEQELRKGIVIPTVLDERVVKTVAEYVKHAYNEEQNHN